MLKEEKGITLIALIVTIVVLIILAGITITGTIQGVDQAKNNTLLANLDMIHHAITERETKYKLTNDENLLVGTKVDISSLTDVPSEIEWKVVQFDGVNNPEREYYRLSSTNLKELGLSTEVSNSASYIVNYYTGEVYNETDKKTSDNKVLYVTSETNEVSKMGDEIIKDKLLVWYDGENNTGNGHSSNTTVWKDLSGNGNDGIMTDATIESNNAKFNGTSSWVNMPKYNPSKDVTVEVTVELNSIQNGNHYIIGNAEKGGMCLNLMSGKPQFAVYIGNEYKTVISDSALDTDKKYHLVGTYDGTNIKLYINNECLSNPMTGDIKSAANDTEWAIAANPYGKSNTDKGYFGNINIYSARIYNCTLSSNEIKHNYLVEKAKYGIEE